MQKLIATRTPRLDALLYRTPRVDRKILCTSQKYMTLHPVLLAMCAQRGDEWEEVHVSTLEGSGKSARRSGHEVRLSEMQVASENATEPLTRHLYIYSTWTDVSRARASLTLRCITHRRGCALHDVR